MIKLLMITAIVSLIYGTGFFEELDSWISTKWKFCHLPKLVMCGSCVSWWICLLYIIFTQQFNLPMVLGCITMWYISPIISTLMYMIVDFINKGLEEIREYFYIK